MIKVLIVDDSASSRQLIAHVLTADPEIEVIGTAGTGIEAVAILERGRPDVVIMDVYMPGLDGFETTRRIMAEHPTPVIIVTAALDPKSDAAVFRALDAGALAILPKPPALDHPDHRRAAAELVGSVKLMSEVRVVRRSLRLRTPLPSPVPAEAVLRRIDAVGIGASAGGPIAVRKILALLPEGFPVPLFIVQHMAEEFIGGFTEWLGESSAVRVKLAVQGERIAPATAYVAPSGLHMGVDLLDRIRLAPREAGQFLCPSATYLFRSMARRFGERAVGIVLSGMGGDGAPGLKEMRERGAITIAQDEESCLVYGMPAEAVRLKAAEHLLPPEGIAALLKGIVERH